MAATEHGRDMRTCRELSKQLAAANLSAPFLDKPPRLIGAGSYNDVFLIRYDSQAIVLRLSYYSPYTLSKVQGLIRQHLPYKQLLSKAHLVTAQDPVMVKNNYSRFCNMLIEHGVCPHFVYMFHQKDVKCFAALVRDQVKRERQRNNLSFRYNNVSFHEKFQTSLRLKLRQLTDLQLTVAVFHVLYALAVLQHYLPDFRHNDLSLDNILVTLVASGAAAAKYDHYRIGGTDFWVPDAGILTAVTDFDLAHACMTVAPVAACGGKAERPYTLLNQLIVKDQFGNHSDAQARNINGTPNKAFDTYYFLFRLKEALGSRPSEVQRWLAAHEVMHKSGKNKYIAQPYPTLYPNVLLANAPIFAKFRQGPRAPPDPRQHPYTFKPLPALMTSGEHLKDAAMASDLLGLVLECLPPALRMQPRQAGNLVRGIRLDLYCSMARRRRRRRPSWVQQLLLAASSGQQRRHSWVQRKAASPVTPSRSGRQRRFSY
ncbi:hypothetical protein OEZ85_011015 [Tetradesmus obliquus]|uniref:Protein kinase domain-containing protein n=1 Tax=Tetradesmus obliquus TaxID=3088 RepID=A0ABY8TPP4_TETOB|nr:hypothetical protein OEZ85_011015 [Tetradesmus obliquus]